jgi:hypothetical protein
MNISVMSGVPTGMVLTDMFIDGMVIPDEVIAE